MVYIILNGQNIVFSFCLEKIQITYFFGTKTCYSDDDDDS